MNKEKNKQLIALINKGIVINYNIKYNKNKYKINAECELMTSKKPKVNLASIINNLNSTVTELCSTVSGLSSRIDSIEKDIKDIKQDVNSIETKLNNVIKLNDLKV